jgi:hypothetical protein
VKDLSIIIPAYALDDAVGLWATIEACVFDLQNSGLTYDFRVCVNGTSIPPEATETIHKYLSKAGLVGEWINKVEPQCPARARQLLARNCDSKYIFLLDNHCIPMPGYFKRGVEVSDKYKLDLLHSVTHMFTGFRRDYEYRLTLEKNFWANEGYETPLKDEPYPIAAAGHGGIVLRNSTLKETGGYWEGFDGYAGEEMYVDMKYWMLGKKVWLDPKFIHAHWAAPRKYQRRSSEGYFLNMLMAANIIGGEAWLNRVYNNVKNNDILPQPVNNKVSAELSSDDILDVGKYAESLNVSSQPIKTLDASYIDRARYTSREHAAWLARNRSMTLDELLGYFRSNGIRT